MTGQKPALWFTSVYNQDNESKVDQRHFKGFICFLRGVSDHMTAAPPPLPRPDNKKLDRRPPGAVLL